MRHSFIVDEENLLSTLSSNNETNEGVSIVDLSLINRFGIKGKGAPQWLVDQGLDVPNKINQASVQSDGTILLRLSQNELLLQDPLNQRGKVKYLAQLASSSDVRDLGCYSIPYQDSHTCFLLTGNQSPSLLAKLCAVDLRNNHFSVGMIAQTSLARINAIVVRFDQFDLLSYYIFVDSSFGRYCWRCISDAMAQYNGRVKPVEFYLENRYS